MESCLLYRHAQYCISPANGAVKCKKITAVKKQKGLVFLCNAVLKKAKVNGDKRNCILYETVHSIPLLLYNRLRQILFLKSILCTHYCLQDSLKWQFCILLLQINFNLEDKCLHSGRDFLLFWPSENLCYQLPLFSPLDFSPMEWT